MIVLLLLQSLYKVSQVTAYRFLKKTVIVLCKLKFIIVR